MPAAKGRALIWYGQNTEKNIAYDRAVITAVAFLASVLCRKLTSVPMSFEGCRIVLRA
jgi:hypothetical protein